MEAFTGATVLTLVLTAALFFSPEPILVRNQAEVEDPFHAARHQLEKVAQESGEAVHVTGEVLGEVLGAVRGHVGHISEEVVHATKEKVDDAVEAVQGAAECMQEAGTATAKSVKEATSHAVHSTLDSAAHARHKVVETAKEKVGEAASTAQEIVGGAVEHVQQVGAATVSNVKEAASHAVHSSFEKAAHCKEKVEGGIGCAVGAVEATAEAAERRVSKAAHCIKEIPAHAAQSASAAVHSVKDALCQRVEQACKSHQHEELKGTARSVYEQLGERGGDLIEWSMENGQKVREAGSDFTARVKEKTREEVEEFHDTTARSFPEKHGWYEQIMELPRLLPASTLSVINSVRVAMPSAQFFIEVARLLHLIAFAVAFGASVWNIFVAGGTLSRMLSLSQFVYVQSRLFATYFKLTAASNAIVLLSFIILHPWEAAHSVEKWEIVLLFMNVLCSLFNLFYLQPRAYRVERVNVLFMKMVCEKLQLKNVNGFSKHLERELAPAGPEEMNGLRSIPATPPPSPEVSVHAQFNGGVEPPLRALERSFLLVHSAPALFNVVCFAGLMWHAWYLAHVLIL